MPYNNKNDTVELEIGFSSEHLMNFIFDLHFYATFSVPRDNMSVYFSELHEKAQIFRISSVLEIFRNCINASKGLQTNCSFPWPDDNSFMQQHVIKKQFPWYQT
jgi:hypothetical protein